MVIGNVGFGGREHAATDAFLRSDDVSRVYAVPGNDGLSFHTHVRNDRLIRIPQKIETHADMVSLAFHAKDLNVIAFVGPEYPLSHGIVNEFEKAGVAIVGPTQEAAILEGSKAEAKDIMAALKIPIPEYAHFDNPHAAKTYIDDCDYQVVVKADGLAAGKASIVTDDRRGAHDAVNEIMIEKKYGEAGKRVVVEKRIYGEEFSFFLITDGKTLLPIGWGRDYKAVNDHNKGKNTGGMGAYSPYGSRETELTQLVMTRIAEPLINGCRQGVTTANGKKYQFTYKGILYIGGTFTIENGKVEPYVFEINVRMGDPEAQVIYPRLRTDLAHICRAVVDGNLSEIASLEWDPSYHLCVCLTSGALPNNILDRHNKPYSGYPENYKPERIIRGLDKLLPETLVFHSGTSWDKKIQLFRTTGGRVLTIGCIGETLEEARVKTYQEVKKVHFEGIHYRTDIGLKSQPGL
jgi:phosphoribosylamine--glycine ligase